MNDCFERLVSMLIYNVSAADLNKYQDKTVTIRSADARAMVEAFSAIPRDNLWSLQVLSMGCDANSLLHLSDSVPVDLVVESPATEYSLLYQFAELPRKHSVRVTVKAAPGMTKVVKIAQALNFGVRLDVRQPDSALVDELLALAEFYLRGPTVGCPIEPFHSLFLSFYSEMPVNLWKLQEEDPEVDRYVCDDGRVAFSRRLAGLAIPETQFASFLEQHTSVCLAVDECSGCDLFSRCKSFFKLPDKNYRCEHVKRIFVLLDDAAREMRQDEEGFSAIHGRLNALEDSSPTREISPENRSEALTMRPRSSVPESTDSEQFVLSPFAMRRLNQEPPKEFVTHSWINSQYQAVWEPRITKILSCLSELEWRSILAGVRACGLTSVDANRFQAFSLKLAGKGLSVAILEQVVKQDCYAAARRNPLDGEPFDYWCAIGRMPDIQLLKSAHLNHDDEAIGRLLGYPSCCTHFFKRVWIDEGFIDTTWPMAYNTVGRKDVASTSIEIPHPSRCNVLLRWLGLRMVFHLPCSFDCQPTIELANTLTELARSLGYGLEMDWLEELLHWPLEWTGSNGFAEITSPVGKISTVTDPTAEAYRVSYKGTGFAELGRPAVNRTDEPPELPHEASLKEKVETQANFISSSQESVTDHDWYYQDNGFRSLKDMDLCHKPIERMAVRTLSQFGGNVLDLGCGNGALLRKICRSNGNLIPWGVDNCENKIGHARLLNPEFVENFVFSDIFDANETWAPGREFSLVILMLGRLTEVAEASAAALLARIKVHARYLLVYSYDDYPEPLEKLAHKAGVTLYDRSTDANVAMASLDKIR